MNLELIKPTAAVALADIARKMEANGSRVIKLQTGDPDFATHDCIIDAATKALKDGFTHYSFSQGLPVLRSKLASMYSEKSKGVINPDNVLITHGAAEGFFSIISSLINPDDEVLILEPNWPTVDSLILLMGGVPVKVNGLLSDQDLFEMLDSKVSRATKMICINTPNNPTGLVIPQNVLDKICRWAQKKNIYIVVDEVYNFIQYNQPSTSIGFFNEYNKYIYVNSFSKKYAMTGWRIGYVIAEMELIKKILKPSQLAITNVAPFIQLAALEALSNSRVQEYCNFMLAEYHSRCKKITAHCERLNLECIKPEGAFYLFIKLSGLELTDIEFCNRLLNEHLTCLVPGSAFGESGKGFIRISFANKLEEVLEGIDNCKLLINKLN